MNGASDSGSEGRGFESHPGHEGKEVSLIENQGGFFSLAPIIKRIFTELTLT